MKHYENNAINRFFANMAVWSYDHRWIVLFTSLFMLSGSLYLAGKARVDNSFESYFDSHDPVYLAFQQFREDFGSDEIGLLVYEVPGKEHGPFDVDVMRRIAELTEELEAQVPFIDEVTSLTNAEYIEGEEDGLNILRLLEEIPDDQQALLDIREKFLSRKMYVGGLVSADGRFASIVMDMRISQTDPLEHLKLDPQGGDDQDNLYPQPTYRAIEAIIDQPKYSDIRFYHSGDVALNYISNTLIMSEMGRVGIYGAIVVSLLLLLFFGLRPIGVYGPMLIVGLSIIMSSAFVGLMGWRIDMMFGFVPLLMIAVGTADAVHIIAEFHHQLPGKNRRDAIRHTLMRVGLPCLMTTLTTVAGFYSNAFSEIKSIAHLGWYVPVAIFAAFFFTMTLLMVLLSFGKGGEYLTVHDARNEEPHGLLARVLNAVADFDIRHAKTILLFFIVLILLSVEGISRIRVDSNYLEDFSDRVEVKRDTKKIDESLNGTGSLSYLFDTGVADGIKNPEVLKEIERVQQMVEISSPLVVKTTSPVDLVKDINRSFHADDDRYYAVPESRELIAQLLLVYELSGGDELTDFLSPDYSRARLDINVKTAETSEYFVLDQKVKAYLEDEPLEHSTVMLTGVGSLWLKLMDYITSSQIRGLSIAFVVIAVMMCLTFRSVKIGLLSMLPNIAPVFFTLGLMGWLGITLDFGRLLLGGIGIGIAVDDTIHFINRYRNEFDRHGNYQKALRSTLMGVGRPLLITSLVLICGFVMFVFSLLTSQVIFGLLLALIVLVALLADFLMVPAIVLLFKPFGPEKN
ncbi:MAG: MMPL family transporter [Pseudomonadales bacterium]|nr:MMPL family transporter [Pseudomonadales bacterium]